MSVRTREMVTYKNKWHECFASTSAEFYFWNIKHRISSECKDERNFICLGRQEKTFSFLFNKAFTVTEILWLKPWKKLFFHVVWKSCMTS